ncbi:methyltransferase family protein [Dactylosporangium sp. CS-033363]|uniref:methyltransferase family protein n=1 Tax=Dactylosporangium sp. CS-033363 TaxID=3239935 RepID=UPI003D8F9C04
MRRSAAATGSAVFFALAPGTVAGLGPWLLTGWRLRLPFGSWLPVRLLGVLVLVAGTVFLVQAFVRFVVDGLGTPAPIAAPERLVVTGIYRFVRNPMYLAVVAAILGQAAILWQPVLLGYAAVMGAAMVAFVLGYEQPALREQFGAEYEEYCRAVPGWWPRLRPWRAHSR